MTCDAELIKATATLLFTIPKNGTRGERAASDRDGERDDDQNRGDGYDIDPQRIMESNENARKAGVSDRVRFVRGDLFAADLSAATVVTLYLLPDVNMRLRPKLLKELKPGTLVVSHNYGMGDWEPAEVFEMEAEGSTHYVYSWVVPAR